MFFNPACRCCWLTAASASPRSKCHRSRSRGTACSPTSTSDSTIDDRVEGDGASSSGPWSTMTAATSERIQQMRQCMGVATPTNTEAWSTTIVAVATTSTTNCAPMSLSEPRAPLTPKINRSA